MASGRFSVRFHDYTAVSIALTTVAVAFSAVWLYSNQTEVTLFGWMVVVNLYTQAVKLLCLLGAPTSLTGLRPMPRQYSSADTTPDDHCPILHDGASIIQ